MIKFFSLLGLMFVAVSISGCIADSTANGNDEINFIPIDFKIASQGTQIDVPGGQVLEARSWDRFNAIWSTIPSISGESPNPNFVNNQVVVLLSTINACSSLEITDVSENGYTRIVTATEVYASDPGLCDPALEAITAKEYAIVEFERGGYKPVSVIYKQRNDF